MRGCSFSIRLCAVLTVVCLPLITDCGNECDPQNIEKDTGFRFGISFDTTGVEDFIAMTSDEGVIAIARAELMLPASERTFHIHGLIARGDGGHNLEWPWHFLPSLWNLTQESTEVCDAVPSAVGAWFDSLPDTVTSIPFCPLSSYVKAEVR
ncbi:MAG: hypothetical protein JSW58_02550 [Candidatus Latescibacterota bacterium]|nr:MAG: hypothetical protein JSW58_02550 [Candidatus Latescibacterota bacterium]